MNRLAPLAGLLLVGLMMGAILSAQTSNIFVPFLLQRSVVISPTSYLNNLTFYPGQTGTLQLTNIMQALIYTNTTLTLTTLDLNTTRAFTSLSFTLYFGTIAVTLNGLQNATRTLTLTQGAYTMNLAIAYTTVSAITTTVSGKATITIATP